ncbi:MAG: glycosyltransferase [Nitrospirae bacterium]|nr:glycosyltransferase [Nitrospirota bacterium]MDA1305117.1 glycosyltransferase [Nitrospirota bacterium]
MKALKVLLVNLGFLPESVGGSEYYTYHLAKALIQRQYDVTVLTTIKNDELKRFSVHQEYYEDIKVIKIVNSHHYQSTFVDSFIEPNIEKIFRTVLSEEGFDLIHFQHLAYLSGRLPEISDQMNVPSLLTLHDYWHMCFRSQLVREGHGICPGPSGGVFCASCPEPQQPPSMGNSKYPKALKMLTRPFIQKGVAVLQDMLSQATISKMKSWFVKKPVIGRLDAINPHILTILEHQFRFDFFKNQLRFPKFVLSPSAHLKQRFESEGFRDIHVVPLGFETTTHLPPLPFNGTLKIAYIGNFIRNKNGIHLLTELKSLKDHKAIEIHFHGRPVDQQYFAEILQQAKEFPQDTVKFFGGYNSHQDLQDILQKVHLVVFPSLWEENYPLVVRETLLHGVPVIASKLGGVPEAIIEGVNGYLFDPYFEGDLLEKIAHILNEPQRFKHITQGARDTKIESMQDHIDTLCHLYSQAIQKDKGPFEKLEMHERKRYVQKLNILGNTQPKV